MMRDLLMLFEVAPVNRVVLERALASDFGDFEDAVLHEAGRSIGADVLITRNSKHFSKSTLRVYALVAALTEARGAD